MRTILSAAAAAALLSLGALPAAATASHGGAGASAVRRARDVPVGCVSSLGSLSFAYHPLTPADGGQYASGTLQVTCSGDQGAIGEVTLDPGHSGSYVHRLMTSAGGSQLTYNLYLDATYTTVFGDGTAGTVPFVNQPAGSSVSFACYGRIDAGQTAVAAGSYSDTLTVTVVFNPAVPPK